MLAAVCSLLLLSGALLQEAVPLHMPPPRSAQTRDNAADRKGTAVLKGHVTSADGRALRRVQISVRGASLPNARTASTGPDGEYEIGGLPAGRYTIAASRSGFLPSQYGQRRTGEQGKPVEVAEGVTIESIDFTLDRAGVISGRVLDETGEPVANASVYALQSRFYRGRRQFIPVIVDAAVHATTDEKGLYRLTPVVPGEYLIVAKFSERWLSDGKEPQTFAYAASYFPGTANAADAQRIKIAAGQEAGAIDVSLVAGRAATLSGRVTALNEAPFAGANIELTQELMSPDGGSMFMSGSTRAAADGTFRLRDVAPGHYILTASGPSGDRGADSASMELTIAGADINGISLDVDAGGLVAGQVVTDSGDALPSPALRVTTLSANFERSSVAPSRAEDGLVGPDGRFLRRGPTGPAFVRVDGLPPGWALKRVQIGNREVTDVPVDIRARQTLSDIMVVLSKRLPSLGGTATDAQGRPADGPIVLFPADAAKWREATGLLRNSRPDQTGRYRFDTVRPGDYLIVAIDHMEPWQVNDPEFLAAVRNRATKVTIGDEPATLDLRVIR